MADSRPPGVSFSTSGLSQPAQGSTRTRPALVRQPQSSRRGGAGLTIPTPHRTHWGAIDVQCQHSGQRRPSFSTVSQCRTEHELLPVALEFKEVALAVTRGTPLAYVNLVDVVRELLAQYTPEAIAAEPQQFRKCWVSASRTILEG